VSYTPDKIPFFELSLVKLEDNHDLSKFDCVMDAEDKEAHEFLQTTALNYQNMNMAVTYLCRYQDGIAGFITICANSVEFSWNQIKDINAEIRHKEVPALKVAWIGTHKNYRRRGIGKFMMLSAVDIALRLASTVGARIITLDTREGLITYYEKLGFKIINKETKDREHPVMYFDLVKDNII